MLAITGSSAVATLIVLLHPQLPPHTSDSVEVYRVATGIVQADNGRALDKVLAYYAEDAILIPPNTSPVRGLAAIRPRYEALFRDYNPAIEPIIDELVTVGDLAYVRGRNRGALHGRNGTPDRELHDVYLMVLRRTPNRGWRITRLMWHPDGPDSQ